MKTFPKLIFGTSSLGNLYQDLGYETKLAIVKEVIESSKKEYGRVMFDTAGKYGAGLSLEIIGQTLTDLGISVEDISISNKLGWKRVPLSHPGAAPTFESNIWIDLKNDAKQDISYEGIMHCLHQGNELLGGKYRAEAVSVHDPEEYLCDDTFNRDNVNPKKKEDLIGAYKALSELKEKGLVGSIGVGSKDIEAIDYISTDCGVKLDWVMMACCYTIHSHPQHVRDVFTRLHNQGVVIINAAVFNAGFLLGGEYYNYRKLTRNSDRNNKDITDNVNTTGSGDDDLFEWRDQFESVCKEFGISPLAASIQFSFLFGDNAITSVAVNPGSTEHVNDYFTALHRTVIPEAFWNKLRELNLISV